MAPMTSSPPQETQDRTGSPSAHSEKEGAGAHVPTLPADGDSATTADSPGFAFFLFIVCLVMHVILVALHLILVIFRFKLDGNEFRVPLQRLGDITETLFYYVTVYPNIIIKVYLVPLLYITQKLALKRNIHRKQSLTAMHDKGAAWLSLGATSATVWKYRNILRPSEQRRGRDLAPLGGILCILLYLGGGLGLGILAPDLITLGGLVGNTTNIVPVTNFIPGIGGNTVLLQEVFPIIDILPILLGDGDITTTGLAENVIYDIPNFATDAAVRVNGSFFNAECGTIPGLTQAGPLNTADATFPIHVHDLLEDIEIAPTARSLNIRAAQWADETTRDNSAPPSVIFVVSTFPVYDDVDGIKGGEVALGGTVDDNPQTCSVPSDCGPVASVQVMACDITWEAFPGLISVWTDVFPFEIDTSNFTRIESAWSSWSLPPAPTIPALFSTGAFPLLSPASRTVRQYSIEGTDVSGSYTLSMLEDNMMETLGFYKADYQAVDLSQIEGVLEDAIATVFWRAAQRELDTNVEPNDFIVYSASYSVKISKYTPWFGLGISAAMLLIAAFITAQPLPGKKEHRSAHVDGLGVLELTWLLGKNFREQERDPELGGGAPPVSASSEQVYALRLFDGVGRPTLENLRNYAKDMEVDFRDVEDRSVRRRAAV